MDPGKLHEAISQGIMMLILCISKFSIVIGSLHTYLDTHMIFTLMDFFFAMFNTVFNTYEKGYRCFRSENFPTIKDILISALYSTQSNYYYLRLLMV